MGLLLEITGGKRRNGNEITRVCGRWSARREAERPRATEKGTLSREKLRGS